MRTPPLDEPEPISATPIPEPPPPDTSSLKQLLQLIHESLLSNDFESTVRHADAFRRVLRSRMEEEDAPGGLLTSMENGEPRLAPRVHRLREQRRNVLRLLANIRDAASFSLDKTKLLVPLLLLMFRQYERNTRRVVGEFYFYDDVGCDGG